MLLCTFVGERVVVSEGKLVIDTVGSTDGVGELLLVTLRET